MQILVPVDFGCQTACACRIRAVRPTSLLPITVAPYYAPRMKCRKPP